jgi:hypothetical protein
MRGRYISQLSHQQTLTADSTMIKSIKPQSTCDTRRRPLLAPWPTSTHGRHTLRYLAPCPSVASHMCVRVFAPSATSDADAKRGFGKRARLPRLESSPSSWWPASYRLVDGTPASQLTATCQRPEAVAPLLGLGWRPTKCGFASVACHQWHLGEQRCVDVRYGGEQNSIASY